MSLLADDPLTKLSFAVHGSKGVFALLLGSGMSRAAQIPTGWEITLDLVRRVAAAKGIENHSDWAAWYRDQTGTEPNYSSLLEELTPSPAERRAILHGYIEPNEEDREEGRKQPTDAHRAIAALVASGHIKVIITTNFDRLTENALRETGIDPTVVASADALQGAEPLVHSTCYILKIHGDYRDARILNTDAELASYPDEYNRLLDRILDEYGLIVCGWSGEWDEALRAAFLRAPNRRYTTYWAARGTVGRAAQDLIDHRRASIIPIADADGFFTGLRQRVETLEQSQRQNPLSIELLVNSTKRFLSKPEFRIQLDELLTDEAKRLIDRLDSTDFATDRPLNSEEFEKTVARYEAATEPLLRMAGVLGRWGDGADFPLVLDIIRNLYITTMSGRWGTIHWIELHSYPVVLVMMAYALALIKSSRWKTLHELFVSLVKDSHGTNKRIVDTLFTSIWGGGDGDLWKHMKAYSNNYTPFATYISGRFRSFSSDFIVITSETDDLYNWFELLGMLAYFETENEEEVRKSLSSGQPDNYVWMPGGKLSRSSQTLSLLIEEIKLDGVIDPILKGGFAKGNPQFLKTFLDNTISLFRHNPLF